MGLAAAAMRSHVPAARTIGVDVLSTRVSLTAFATVIAGIGGALLAVSVNNANPSSYLTLSGLVWLAIVVTFGMRSCVGAALAGLSFAIITSVFSTYLPVSLAQVPVALFGLGAVLVVRNPDGMIAMHARQVDLIAQRLWPWAWRKSPPGLSEHIDSAEDGRRVFESISSAKDDHEPSSFTGVQP